MSCDVTGYTGSKYCKEKSLPQEPLGLIFMSDSLEFTAADYLLKAKWFEAINQQKAFPIMLSEEFTQNDTDPVYKEYGSGRRRNIDKGDYRFQMMFDKNQTIKKQLLKFNGWSQRVAIVYKNTIRLQTLDDGVTMKGVPVSDVLIGKETLGDFGDVSMIPVDIDIKDQKSFNEYDYSMPLTWVDELDGLTPVTIEQVGAGSATAFSFKIYTTINGSEYPISGLVEADFDADVTGSPTIAENSSTAGQYDASGTGFATGTINLKDPASLTTTDLLIISAGAAAITIT